MIVLDQTVVNVALPTIQRDLHFSQSSLSWTINAYLITFGGLLLLAGRLGDLIGPKKVFLTGLVIFTSASAWCGFSGSQGELIGARFVQGIGAAVVAATVLGILVTLFPGPREKAVAIGVYACISVAGGIIGLLVGGALTQALSWHWIFFINLPVGGIGVVAGSVLIAEREGSGIRNGVDVVGAVLVTSATMFLSYAIIEASGNGWGSVRTIGVGGGALGLLALFIWVERHARNPMVPLRIFRSRNISGATVVRALFPFAGVGAPYIGSLYLQHVLGYSPIKTGLSFLPMFAGAALLPLLVTPHLVLRVGAKATLIPGLTCLAAGLALLGLMPMHGRYAAVVLPAMLVLGIGGGLVSSPMLALCMVGVAPSDTGLASGLANASSQLGGGLAVAVLASISTSRTNHLITEGGRRATAIVAGYHLAFFSAAACVAAAAIFAIVVFRDAHVGRA